MIELRTLNGQYTIQQLLYRKIQNKFKKKSCSSNVKGVRNQKKWEARIWNSKIRKNECLEDSLDFSQPKAKREAPKK